jgi:hypothetical protein
MKVFQTRGAFTSSFSYALPKWILGPVIPASKFRIRRLPRQDKGVFCHSTNYGCIFHPYFSLITIFVIVYVLNIGLVEEPNGFATSRSKMFRVTE